jgi:hypothetical protein
VHGLRLEGFGGSMAREGSMRLLLRVRKGGRGVACGYGLREVEVSEVTGRTWTRVL